MTSTEGIAAVVAFLSIVFFALYVAAILRMPTGRRPKVVPLNRFGEDLQPDENPDYRDTEEEHH